MTTMPSRLPRNPFASSPNPAAIPPVDKASPRRPSTSKGNRLTQYFTSSPKSKEQQSAQAALLATIAAQQQHLLNNPSPPSLALPTISLSTAQGGDLSMDEMPTTLFQPPSVAEAKRQARVDAQFGPLLNPNHRYVSKHVGGEFEEPVFDEPPYYFLLTTYISYLVLIVFGHVRDFFGKQFTPKYFKHLRESDGYAALNSDFDNFYIRRLKMRINDCFSRPITGVPGRYITLMDRKTDNFNESFQFTGTYTETLNISSYNYLGFAQSEGPCADAVEESIKKYGISAASPRSDVGTSDLALEVEDRISKFVGKPAAMVFSMGFVTNAGAFPALISKGSYVISDELNHASLRVGMRLSGAMITSFKHNDMKDLEKKLRDAISQGQPRTHRPWKKILVVVEGLYSMEGTMVNLPAVMRLKKKYKFHLFVDEAHSIGAIGPNGRGVCDYFGIDPSEIDILMGTFTKSFGANGGYICAEKHIIDKLRVTNAATIYGESPTPPVLMQILSSLKIIAGDLVPGQGEERLQRIAFNSRYLRLGLKRLGFIVYGHDDSPIIPIVLYNPAKMPAFSHEMLKRKISVVIVGYPATPLVESRARFCVSSAHNKDDMDRILAACDEIGNVLQLKFSTGIAGGRDSLPDGITAEMEKEWEKANGLQGVIKPPRWGLREVIANGVNDVKYPLR